MSENNLMEEVRQYLAAASDGSMSRNNSEQLASELLTLMQDDCMSPAEQTCLIFAARYAHHRQTGAALQVVTAIAQNWDKLSDHTREQLQREAKEATTNLEDWRLVINRQ